MLWQHALWPFAVVISRHEMHVKLQRALTGVKNLPLLRVEETLPSEGCKEGKALKIEMMFVKT